MIRIWPSLPIALALLLLFGCDWMPGKPDKADRPVLPSQVMSFDGLYGDNCAGCHGAEGTLGASLPLNVPVYLAWAGRENLVRITSDGIEGTMMPGFLESAGGTLTKAQIEALIDQMLKRWGRSDATEDLPLPPYRASVSSGDPARGAIAYQTFCEHCHGKDGKGGPQGGSITDGAYLALVSDQALRTVVVAGRRDLGMPDWRSYVDGRAMTPEEINDVVAWLASHRKQFPGQPYARREDMN